MNKKDIREGLGDLAARAEMDHEVQMARADLYKIAKYAIKLHDMLKGVSEEQGLEGWQQAKITKAADYIGSVYHNLDYDMKFGNGGKMDAEVASESKTVKENTKKLVTEFEKDIYKESLAGKLKEKITSSTPMGDVVKDFYASDAPQFKGKSKKKRRQMAIAAKLGQQDGRS